VFDFLSNVDFWCFPLYNDVSWFYYYWIWWGWLEDDFTFNFYIW